MKDLNQTTVSLAEYGTAASNWLTATRQLMSPKTTNRRLTSLKSFARWAGWGAIEELDEYSPPSSDKGQPHPLPEGVEGVKRMIDATSSEKHKALITLCGFLGCRIGEALDVRPSHFDLIDMKLTIRGKGDKTRVVPVSTYAWSQLALPVTQAFVRNDETVVGLKDRFAREVVTKLGQRANLKRAISSHDLRATFATEVYNKTLDIRVVQYLLGHSDITTTEIYVGRTGEQIKAAVEIG